MREKPGTGSGRVKALKRNSAIDVVTVTLNAAIDQTLQIPNFAAGTVNRVQSTRERPGGKGVNVAAALADYGKPVAATGFLGRDNVESFEAMFATRRIEDHFVRIAGQTRTGIKITDPVRMETTDINFPGAIPRRADLTALTHALDRLAAPGRWFALSGSLPPGQDPRTYARLIARLRKIGARTMLDTSGEPLGMAVQARPDIIKPNLHELEMLVGHKPSSVTAAARAARLLLGLGIELVVISMGEKGACFVNGEQSIVALPPRVEVRSTVGAGDAMVAGILLAVLEGRSLEEMARIATAFSLEVVTRGESGLGSRTAISDWARHVVCRRIPRRD